MSWKSRHGGRLGDCHVHNPLSVQCITDPRLFSLLLVKKIISFRFLDLSEKVLLRRPVHIDRRQAESDIGGLR